MRDEGPEACQQLFARRHVSFQRHPRARPVVQIAAVGEASEDGADVVARVTLEVFAFEIMRAMELTTILNLCHHHRGFVYHHTRFGPDQKSVEVHVRPRAGSAAVCSGCHRPARVTITFPNGASSSSPSGEFWYFSYIVCGTSSAAIVAWWRDRKSVALGKSGGLGGRRII